MRSVAGGAATGRELKLQSQDSANRSFMTGCSAWRDAPEHHPMSAYDAFVLAVAGANGGLFYYAIARRERLYAWAKARARRR